MLELIILLSILMVALSVGMLLLKFVFTMILLPFKILFFLTKGLLGLVLLVPLLLIFGVAFLAVVPIGAIILFLPLLSAAGITLFRDRHAAELRWFGPRNDQRRTLLTQAPHQRLERRGRAAVQVHR